MNPTTLNRPPQEVAEIERHKYFLSEKAGHDVGWEFAEQDWEANHANEVRRRTNPGLDPPAARGLSRILDRIMSRGHRRNPK